VVKQIIVILSDSEESKPLTIDSLLRSE